MVEAEAIADTTVRGSRTAFRAGSTSIARGRGVFEDLEVKVLTELLTKNFLQNPVC